MIKFPKMRCRNNRPCNCWTGISVAIGGLVVHFQGGKATIDVVQVVVSSYPASDLAMKDGVSCH